MSVSRRSFIRIGGLTALAAFAAPDRFFGKGRKDLPFENFGNDVFQLRGNDLESLIGSHFWLTTDSESVQAVLIEVKKSSRRELSRKNGTECFSLVFSLKDNEPRAQETYAVTHQTLGNFPLFLVPGKGAMGEPLLIAAFNRL